MSLQPQTSATHPPAKQTTPSYTTREEIANSLTHGLGAVLSLVGLILLITLAIRAGDPLRVVSFSIYGGSLVLLYLASTLYHAFQQPRLKNVFKVIDHTSIYVLIAGSYTPFLLVGLRGSLGWTLLGIIWGLAVLGVSFKAFFIQRFQKLSVLTYVLMGWLCVVAGREMLANIPAGALIWLASGGVVYTLGVIFYLLKSVRYSHTIWHLFVLGGSLCHYFAVLFYLAPTT